MYSEHMKERHFFQCYRLTLFLAFLTLINRTAVSHWAARYRSHRTLHLLHTQVHPFSASSSPIYHYRREIALFYNNSYQYQRALIFFSISVELYRSCNNLLVKTLINLFYSTFWFKKTVIKIEVIKKVSHIYIFDKVISSKEQRFLCISNLRNFHV